MGFCLIYAAAGVTRYRLRAQDIAARPRLFIRRAGAAAPMENPNRITNLITGRFGPSA